MLAGPPSRHRALASSPTVLRRDKILVWWRGAHGRTRQREGASCSPQTERTRHRVLPSAARASPGTARCGVAQRAVHRVATFGSSHESSTRGHRMGTRLGLAFMASWPSLRDTTVTCYEAAKQCTPFNRAVHRACHVPSPRQQNAPRDMATGRPLRGSSADMFVTLRDRGSKPQGSQVDPVPCDAGSPSETLSAARGQWSTPPNGKLPDPLVLVQHELTGALQIRPAGDGRVPTVCFGVGWPIPAQ